MAAVLTCMVNLLVGFVLVLIVQRLFGGDIGLTILWWPAIFAIQFVLVLGLALLFSCLNVLYRDVSYIVGVALMFGFYASPVFYELSFVRSNFAPHFPKLYCLYTLNPMVAIITAYRSALLDGQSPELGALVWPAGLALAVFLLGVLVFRRQAPVLADYL